MTEVKYIVVSGIEGKDMYECGEVCSNYEAAVKVFKYAIEDEKEYVEEDRFFMHNLRHGERYIVELDKDIYEDGELVDYEVVDYEVIAEK